MSADKLTEEDVYATALLVCGPPPWREWKFWQYTITLNMAVSSRSPRRQDAIKAYREDVVEVFLTAHSTQTTWTGYLKWLKERPNYNG